MKIPWLVKTALWILEHMPWFPMALRPVVTWLESLVEQIPASKGQSDAKAELADAVQKASEQKSHRPLLNWLSKHLGKLRPGVSNPQSK